MIVEILEPLLVRIGGEIRRLDRGQLDLPDAPARKLLEKKPDTVRAIAPPQPIPPISSGWLVAYRDKEGRLTGGYDDRGRGTVATVKYNSEGWVVTLTDGTLLPLGAVLAVAQIGADGRFVAAWNVRDHGFDGMTMRYH